MFYKNIKSETNEYFVLCTKQFLDTETPVQAPNVEPGRTSLVVEESNVCVDEGDPMVITGLGHPCIVRRPTRRSYVLHPTLHDIVNINISIF